MNDYDRSIIARALQHYAHWLKNDPLRVFTPKGTAKMSDRALELAWEFRPAMGQESVKARSKDAENEGR